MSPALRSIVLAIALVFSSTSGIADAQAQSVIDRTVAQRVLQNKDGLLENIKTEYNNIHITKRGSRVVMSFQRQGNDYIESISNLADETELTVAYTQGMTVGLAYPEKTPAKVLMIGLGGGSLTTYLARYLTGAQFDNVELDPGVVTAAKKYFGLTEGDRFRLIAADGRMFLTQQSGTYGLILIDAFRGGYVPLHLVTKEFNQALAQRLEPTGVAVFNLHKDTKLFDSMLKTLSTVFPSIDMYGTGTGSIIVVASTEAKLDHSTLLARATARQQRHGFRYALPLLVASRQGSPAIPATAQTLTDDFAPADARDAIVKHNARRW